MEAKGVMFEGKTLDDAVRKGLDALGLSRAEVMIQVMEEGSGGFLGIGSRPYKVRMMPRPRRELSERPEPGDRRERARGSRGGRSERGGRGGRGGRAEASERGDRGPRSERAERGRGEREGRGDRGGRGGRREARPGDGRQERGAPEPEPRPEPAAAADAPVARNRDEGADEGRRGRRRRRGGRNHEDRGREPRPPQHGSAEAAGDREPGSSGNGSLMPPDELAAMGRGLAENLFRAMGFEVQITAHAEGDSVEVRAEIGQDSDLITGEKGEVRQSIQHLLNRMLNRGGSARYHLQLEINDFWAQRENELREMARRLAEEAVADDAEKLTEYLNAQERRVVHMALRDDTRVKTFGLGDGLIKKVAIAPASAVTQEPKPDE